MPKYCALVASNPPKRALWTVEPDEEEGGPEMNRMEEGGRESIFVIRIGVKLVEVIDLGIGWLIGSSAKGKGKEL